MNLSVKLLNGLNEPVPTLEKLISRYTITYVCSVAYMYWKKIRDPFIGPKGVRTLLVFRGLTGFLGISGMYFSLQYLSLSDATALSFLSPILTGFSGAVFLKETLSLREVLAGLCSFVGVILIARPQSLFGSLQMFSAPSEVTPTQRKLSVIAALIGVVGSTGAYTLIRGIGKRAHVLHSMMFFSSQCVLASTLGMILFKQPLVIPTHPSSLVMLFLIGVFIFFAQILLTMGLQRETAGRGTLAIYSSIVFAVVFESIVFHTTPSALLIIGTLIIVSSAIYITLTKKLVSQHDTTSERPAPNHDSNLEA
ncbi:drug/metabolite transporter superfamily [Lactarius quietus]|nr:drug/metabolite transporter superfamily [Lactarius quietus]